MRLTDKTACLSCVKNYSEVIVTLQENYRQRLENSPISNIHKCAGWFNRWGYTTSCFHIFGVSDNFFNKNVSGLLLLAGHSNRFKGTDLWICRRLDVYWIIFHALYFSETFQSFFFISKNLQVPMQLRSLFLLTEMTRYALHRIEFILSFMCLCSILKCRKSCLEIFFRSFPLKWQVHATTSVKFC